MSLQNPQHFRKAHKFMVINRIL